MFENKEKMMSSKLDASKVYAYFKERSGYDIVDPQAYRDAGFPEDFIKRLTYTHPSGTGKYAITRADGSVGDVRGIYDLEAADIAARMLGADTRVADLKFGRGSRYRELVHAIGLIVREKVKLTAS